MPTLTTLCLSQPNPRNEQRDVQFSSQNQVKTKKKVITFSDVQFSSQNQVKTRKNIITSFDVQFSSQNQVKTKERLSRLSTSNFPPKIRWRPKKGHYIFRCPIFLPKSGEDQKKVITSFDVQFSFQNQVASDSLSTPQTVIGYWRTSTEPQRLLRRTLRVRSNPS